METPARVEKIMSLNVAEFELSLARLAPGHEVVEPGRRYALALKAGTVTITLEPLQSVTLGGLIRLPRSRVEIDVSALADAERGRVHRPI